MKQMTSSKIMFKVYVTNVVNIILLVGIVFFLDKVTLTAKDVQKKHSEVLALDQRAEDKVLAANLEKVKPTVDELHKAFLDEEGIVTFVQKLEELKKNGVVTDTSFPSNQPVTDGARGKGLPLLVKIEGNKDKVNTAVTALDNLPSIIRPVSLKMTKDIDAYKLEYGVFVYVK